MHKIGYVHVPRTAGNSLSGIIHGAMGLRCTHISKLVSRVEAAPERVSKSYLLVRNSNAFKFACNAIFLSGHISYADMAEMDRTFIFTVLRDPRKRLISLYTYLQTRINNGRQPASALGKSFIEFAQTGMVRNGITKLLVGDSPSYIRWVRKSRKLPIELLEEIFVDHLEESLTRFNKIYTCDQQSVLDDLSKCGLIPPAISVRQNASHPRIGLGHLGVREDFLAVIDRATHWDMRLYQQAQRIFPHDKSLVLDSDQMFFDYVKNNYPCTFSDS